MLKCNISKTAIDRAGNALAKEKFKTYEEWRLLIKYLMNLDKLIYSR